MARSPGFGSNPGNSFRPLQTRFRCASTYRLKLAAETKSLTHYTRGTRSGARRRRASRSQEPGVRNQKPEGHLLPLSDFCLLSSDFSSSPSVSPLPLLVGIRFQDLFHSPHRGAFHLSLTVLVHYR